LIYKILSWLNNKPYKSIILFGVLSFLTWFLLPFFSFLKFLPFFFVAQSKNKFATKWLTIFISFLVENTICTYWLADFSIVKAALLYVIGALYYAIPCLLSLTIENKKKDYGIYLFPLVFALTDTFQNTVSLNLVWLTAGNSLGSVPCLIQWYQLLGAVGGTLWIGYINVLIYLILRDAKLKKKVYGNLMILIITLFIPISTSVLFFYCKRSKSQPINIAFTKTTNESNIQHWIEILKNYRFQSDIAFFPETFLNNKVEDKVEKNSSASALLKGLKKHGVQALVTGININAFDSTGELSDSIWCYKYKFRKYNAMACYTDNSLQLKSKKLLIPFEEYAPGFLKKYFGYSCSNYSIVNDNGNSFQINKTHFLPLICYEITNTAFIANAISDDDVFISLSAGEDFMHGNQHALKQYLNLTRIRAIEFRKYIVKSSSMGYAACINERGQLIKVSTLKKENQLLTANIFAIPGRSLFSILEPSIKYIILTVITILFIKSCYYENKKTTNFVRDPST